MEIFIIIGLILLNGVFSMAEMSLISSRKFKLDAAKKKGKIGAKMALELADNPTKFLSTVQIGITLIGILLGIYSGEKLTQNTTKFFIRFTVLIPYAEELAVGVILIFITFLTIVLGELLPKRLGLTFPEPIAMALARPMKFLSFLTSPFVWLLTFTNDIILNIFGIKHSLDSKVSEEEIKSIIKESADGGEIQEIEQGIVERVFELGDRKVNSLVTHRSSIVFFSEGDNLEMIRLKINSEKHSAYPVCKDNKIDEILGIILLKDLFTPSIEENFQIMNYVKKPLFINQGMSAYKLLETFKNEKIHCGIVVDEYGITQGIVTMDDVLDALIGDVTESNQEEYQITQRNENSWLVDGQYSIIEFVKFFEIDLEDNYQDDFVTVAGLFIHQFSTLPNVGDKLIVSDLVLEIIDKDGQRIDKILVERL
jgi:putative hemolysin